MNKPESSLDEWRKEAERLIDDYASTEGLVGLNKKWADIQAHLAAHPSNQVLQEPVAPIELNYVQAEGLLAMFGGEQEEDNSITLMNGEGHSGPGLYAHYSEYPEEGSILLAASPQAVPSEQPIAEQPKSDKANLMVAVGSDLPPAPSNTAEQRIAELRSDLARLREDIRNGVVSNIDPETMALAEDTARVVAARQASEYFDGGWCWMVHPSRNNGSAIPVKMETVDGVRFYKPLDPDGATEFEWDERDEEWQIVTGPSAESDAAFELYCAQVAGGHLAALVDELRAEVATLKEARVEPVVGPLSSARSDLPSMPPPAASLPVSAPEVPAEFEEWLCEQMPAGSQIGNPKWWAPRIWRAAMSASSKEN